MKILALILLGTMLTACSTVAGLGRDISSGAEWTKEKMGKAL